MTACGAVIGEGSASLEPAASTSSSSRGATADHGLRSDNHTWRTCLANQASPAGRRGGATGPVAAPGSTRRTAPGRTAAIVDGAPAAAGPRPRGGAPVVRSRWPVHADRVGRLAQGLGAAPAEEEEKHEIILPDTAEICAYRYESPAFRVFGTHTRPGAGGGEPGSQGRRHAVTGSRQERREARRKRLEGPAAYHLPPQPPALASWAGICPPSPVQTVKVELTSMSKPSS